MLRHERVREIPQLLARHDVLVDGHAAQEAEADFVSGRHDRRVAGPRAAQHVAGEDRCAGRRAADHAAAGQHVVEGALGLRAGIRVHEVPLASPSNQTPPARASGAAKLSVSARRRSVVWSTTTLRDPAALSARVPRQSAGYTLSPPAVGTSTISASGPPASSMNFAYSSGPCAPPPTTMTTPRAGPTVVRAGELAAVCAAASMETLESVRIASVESVRSFIDSAMEVCAWRGKLHPPSQHAAARRSVGPWF